MDWVKHYIIMIGRGDGELVDIPEDDEGGPPEMSGVGGVLNIEELAEKARESAGLKRRIEERIEERPAKAGRGESSLQSQM